MPPRRRGQATTTKTTVTRERIAKPPANATTISDVELIPVASIMTSTPNPRRRLHAIDELAASLSSHGLLQPVLVRKSNNEYFELVAGHRRLAAATQLGWQTIPAIVRSVDEVEAYVLTIVENLQREDLSPREESDALAVLVKQRKWSTHQVAAAIQRSQAYVSKRLRVFEDQMLGPAVVAGDLTVSAAEELLSVPDRHRYDVAARAIEGGWDVPTIREFVRKRRFDANRPGQRRQPGLDRRIHTLRFELRDLLAEDLTDPDRRELRLLFRELAQLAQAKPGAQRVFPELPQVRPARQQRASRGR
ncbi:MAG TPA: ParB/RepB/Spo0J family partition protein [Chloroflexota bacterium]|jgi:ParB family chromosome partitioning protein|nr:ParB/RepB/Spo0J family partition protein [Chloroflexota bacterium]